MKKSWGMKKCKKWFKKEREMMKKSWGMKKCKKWFKKEKCLKRKRKSELKVSMSCSLIR